MASSDDDIPDLFPSASEPGEAERGPASKRPPAPTRAKRPPAQTRSQRPPAPRPPRPAGLEDRGPSRPDPSLDDQTRPSRPLAGPDSGIELDPIDSDANRSGLETHPGDEVDALEFDPISQQEPVALDWAPAGEEPSGLAKGESNQPGRSAFELEVPSLPAAAKPAGTAGAPVGRASNPRQASSGEDPVNHGLDLFSTMGGEVDLGAGLEDLGGGLEDLGLGGAEAAQMNVAVPRFSPDDDVPWPKGRTPTRDELAIDANEALDLSGFGAAPSGFAAQPMYALRVFVALRDLEQRFIAAKKHLRDVEDSRDERLAELALDKRAEIEGNDRFAALFAQVDRHDQHIHQKKLALESADVEGAQTLRDVQAEIDTLEAERVGKERVRDEQRVVAAEAERLTQRCGAALKRIDIQWRNVEQRAARLPGKEMPDELDQQLDDLEQQRETERKSLQYAKSQLAEVRRLLESAENDCRVARAQLERAEAQKEGLLMAYEGEIAAHSRELDRALYERQKALSDVGRALVELHGEVAVRGSVRQALLAADDAVETAACRLHTLDLALDSMDTTAYKQGRAVWIGAIVLLLVIVVWSAF